MRTNSALPKDMEGLEPTTPYDVAEHLRTPEERAAYLEACIAEDGRDEAFIAKARADIERAERRHMPSGDQTEAERLERIALIENEAEKVFGASDMARDWLTKNNAALGATPLSMLDTGAGAGEVRKVLGSIASGGAV